MATPDTVHSLARRLEPLALRANLSWWDASTKVSPEHEAARVAADVALREALADPDEFRAVDAARADPDPVIARDAAILHASMLPQQVPADIRRRIVELEAEIDGVFNSHRPVVAGVARTDNEVGEILRTSADVAERKEAWEAAKTVGAAVADRVRTLAHLRNEAARAVGHRDFFALSLATAELDEDQLLDTLDAVDDATRDRFAEWKRGDDEFRAERFGVSAAELRPWHYADPFFQEPPTSDALDLDAWFRPLDLVALTRRTYAQLGLDIDGILDASDLLPREAKSQHAFCISVDRGADVRVLCNNVAGEYWAETMLHEFGHAVYDLGVDRSLPWPQRTMHALTTEGIAMLFGRLTMDPEWLRTVAGIDTGTVAGTEAALARRRLVGLLVFARWVLVMTNFERGLYADPDADHDALWWDLVERFQLLHRPDGRHAPDWAAKLHVALAPVYYQNYLLGELVASRLQATLTERFGGIVDRPAVGDYLRTQFFGPGWSCTWAELVERATGRPLSTDSFAAELTALATAAATATTDAPA